jgi:hypothetical protein
MFDFINTSRVFGQTIIKNNQYILGSEKAIANSEPWAIA